MWRVCSDVPSDVYVYHAGSGERYPVHFRSNLPAAIATAQALNLAEKESNGGADQEGSR